LSYRLAEFRHRPVAVDIFSINATVAPAPLSSFDSVVEETSTGSLWRPALTWWFQRVFPLFAGLRAYVGGSPAVSAAEGRVVILDSPVYNSASMGADARRAPASSSKSMDSDPRLSAASSTWMSQCWVNSPRSSTDLARPQAVVWIRLDAASMEGTACGTTASFAFLDPGRLVSIAMIILLHPRSTRPKNRRFPLSVLALGAILEGKEDYQIVDGNIDPRPMDTIEQIAGQTAKCGLSVMPGPQWSGDIALEGFRARYPKSQCRGGYFPSLYPDAALNCSYADVLARPG
jgi:hypothetical protein